jgi:isoaspartyl peptidase/L-asparaginase-like protein (Ntn-hydrolase superfamily)
MKANQRFTSLSAANRDLYSELERYNSESHDTIGMVVIDKNGDVSAGTSTNGAGNKIAG